MKKILLPSITFAVFILDSLYVQYFYGPLWGHEWIIVPRFLFITLFFIVLFFNRTQGFIYAICFGLIFDVVFTEILGVYMAIFPLLCYILDRLMKVFHHHLLIIIFVTLIGIVGLEFLVYELNLLLQVTEMPIQEFIQARLIPTLYFNGIFLILFSFPLKKLLLYLQAKILDQ